ncbi:MAG: lysine--tRNA ligase [Candidatus Pacebacteria bacterium]|nr:lysine--tRNA ligase [Candidatus Paceibacterota bacterium]
MSKFWADKLVKGIIDSGKHLPYWVDDMKTPSGRIHVGALRGVVIHGLIHQLLKEAGLKSTYTYVINDMDPMDGFPRYLPEKFRRYMGRPLFKIPSPEKGYSSFARCYAEQFIKTFNSLGFRPKIVWSSEYYLRGKFNRVIEEALDRVVLIRKLYKEISGYDKPGNWYPFQVICPKCGRVGSTIVTNWDGKKVTYECRKNLVDWCSGCGYQGKISPFDGAGKLMWKVDWAAHWKVIGVTIEGAGKDHMTEGGSYDLSSQICRQVFEYPPPFAYLYEWFLAKGGVKMSSSKGIGVSAVEIAATLPPEILRFLLIKTHFKQAIIFDPANNESILDLFDKYDDCAREYWEEKDSLKNRSFQLSQVGKMTKKSFLPRFREVVKRIQNPKMDLVESFARDKGKSLNANEKKILEERIKYARIWLKSYAPDELKLGITKNLPEGVSELSVSQKEYLGKVVRLLKREGWDPEKLQMALYEKTKETSILPKEAFQALYLTLLGKNYGPKAAWLLLEEDQNKIITRLTAAVNYQKGLIKKEKYLYPLLKDSKIFSIDPEFAAKYPSVVVGIALIKGVKVKKQDPVLIREIIQFTQSQSGLTSEQISRFPEIRSYRRLYRETGIDWHKRRPSPESLNRRIARNQGLPNVNNCVDAYNLVVAKYRVSAGAFDSDQIRFPTVLRFAQKGENILLLGDREPTEYLPGEVAYFDQAGGYNIDFNYKDAARTLVTEKTTNLLINTEGIFEIGRHQVERTLQETIDKIIKYCGGKLESAGIAVA